MNKKIIILGHSGFIGSHLENELSATGMWDVVGRSLPDVDLVNFESASQLKSFLVPDAVLVLAAAVKRQFGDSLDTYQRNIAIVQNICRLLQTNPVGRVIFVSSAAVYGEETNNINIDEKAKVNPTSYYGISKYAAERLLQKACEENKVTSLVCLRPPLVYGPGDQGQTYGPSGFAAAAKEGKAITLWGDGTELREFIYVADLCRVIECLGSSNYQGVINIVSGQSYRFIDIVKALKIIFPDLATNDQARSQKKVENSFDPHRLKSLLPSDFLFTPLEQGLALTLGQR